MYKSIGLLTGAESQAKSYLLSEVRNTNESYLKNLTGISLLTDQAALILG